LPIFARHLPTLGAEIVNGPKDVPTGRNMLVRHPDGTLIEYVEHRHKHAADRMYEPAEGMVGQSPEGSARGTPAP
jgi:hypothetical protein